MSLLATELGTNASMRATRSGIDPWSIAVWLAAVLIAVFFALIDSDATIFDGVYLPRGNDSFYHARRIIDAAVGTQGFYQFDDRLHVPEGAWIPWPWAYDYLLAQALRIALWVSPTLDPVAFLCYVPVGWLLVNTALFMAAAGAIGLSREMRLVAMLCFALSPLTQLLHTIGMVDHHFVELTFILLSIWLGIEWFKNLQSTRYAVALGLALGVAPAFHSGLFILQLAPLGGALTLWLRASAPSLRTLEAFCIALLIATQLILLPSLPYREGMFEFGLLSWFHFYVALSTGAALLFIGARPFSKRTLGGLLALCVALAIPLGAQIISGAGFVSGDFSILDDIIEVHSPYRMFTSTFGPQATLSFYSWLLLLVPALLTYYAYRIFRVRAPHDLYFAIVVVFGLTLLLQQFRLHYFGFFGLVAGALLIVDRLRSQHGWHRGAVFAATLGAIALAYQPALRDRLFVVYAPGADVDYASTLSIFFDLRALCAENPGVVLASPDDGNAILFHSDCSVIANHFILRPEDEQHIKEVDRLMHLSPAEIRAERPDVRYVFVRFRDFSILHGDTAYIVEDIPIARQLLLDETPPEGYTLIKTVKLRIGPDGDAGIFARLFAVSPIPAITPP